MTTVNCAFGYNRVSSLLTVMNFQSIRNDFNQQVKEQTEALEAVQMRAHLAEELERQDRLHARTRYRHYKTRQANIHVLCIYMVTYNNYCSPGP